VNLEATHQWTTLRTLHAVALTLLIFANSPAPNPTHTGRSHRNLEQCHLAPLSLSLPPQQPSDEDMVRPLQKTTNTIQSPVLVLGWSPWVSLARQNLDNYHGLAFRVWPRMPVRVNNSSVPVSLDIVIVPALNLSSSFGILCLTVSLVVLICWCMADE
jgi:hypothetical protein